MYDSLAKDEKAYLRGTNRRDFMIASALGGTALLSGLISWRSASEAPERRRSLDSLIPDTIGEWTHSRTADLKIPKGETEERTYDDVLTRHYTSDSAAAIMLLIAYGSAQQGGTQLHRPEVCYPAAGFSLKTRPDAKIELAGKTIPVRALSAHAPGRIEQILYWTRIGDHFPTSSIHQRWSVIRETMRGAAPDGALVRISTLGPDHEAGQSTLESFATALVRSGSQETLQLLVGRH